MFLEVQLMIPFIRLLRRHGRHTEKSNHLLRSCNHHQGQTFDELFAINTPVGWECVGRSRSLLLRTQAMNRARAKSKWTMIGQMATDILCLDFTIVDVRWLLVFFSETDFIYNYLYIVQKWTKSQHGKLKTFQDFRPRDVESCHIAAARRVKLWYMQRTTEHGFALLPIVQSIEYENKRWHRKL